MSITELCETGMLWVPMCLPHPTLISSDVLVGVIFVEVCCLDLGLERRIESGSLMVLLLQEVAPDGIGSTEQSNLDYFQQGLVGSGRMVGERLSSSGTRLDSCSPLGLAKSSTESLKPPRTFKSVSRQSLLDIVTSKLGVTRKTPHQRYLSRWRDSMSAASGGCVTRGVCSEMDLSRRGGGGGRRPNPPPQRPQKLAGTPSSTGGHPPSHSFSLVFDPAGRLCYYWSMVVSIAFLYNFWVIIYRFAFQEINSE
ncbi:hypothetical protein GE061_017710 [Apolygus lucorum]|uniref:Uncharacterized protein n=1 Tax=Apolygus lucorum TaxID=248454 RepID=A0A8S9XBS8_APOLU|nr:hypothetical protein GE061_017710 [Apolygus lucorum]